MAKAKPYRPSKTELIRLLRPFLNHWSPRNDEERNKVENAAKEVEKKRQELLRDTEYQRLRRKADRLRRNFYTKKDKRAKEADALITEIKLKGPIPSMIKKVAAFLGVKNVRPR